MDWKDIKNWPLDNFPTFGILAGFAGFFPAHALLNTYLTSNGHEPLPYSLATEMAFGVIIGTPISLMMSYAKFIRDLEEQKILDQKRQDALNYARKGDMHRAFIYGPGGKLDDIQSRIITAFQLTNKRSQDISTNNQWKEIVEDIPSETAFIDVKGNRNEILKIDDEDIGRVIVVKRAKNLSKEYRLLSQLEKELEEDNPCVRPLARFKINGTDHMITAYERKTGLEEYLDNPLQLEDVQSQAMQSVKSLAMLHSMEPRINLDLYNPLQEIQRRLFNRFDESREGTELLLEYQRFMGRRQMVEPVFSHGDFSVQNNFTRGSFLDLESSCMADPVLDLETFFAAIQFQNIDQEKVVDHYIQNITEMTGRKPHLDNRPWFAIHTSMCYTGTYFARKDDGRMAYSIDRAVHKMEEFGASNLKSKFLRYLAVEPKVAV